MEFVVNAILVLLLLVLAVLLIEMTLFLLQTIYEDVFRLKEWIKEKRGGGTS